MTDLSPDLVALLLDSATDIIALHDPDGTFRWVSGAVRDVLGYEPGDLCGRSALVVVDPADEARVRTDLADFPTRPPDAPPHVGTYRCRAANGRLVWLEARVQVVRDTGGLVTGLVVVSRDVTERLAREEAQRQEVALFEAAFNHSAAGINVYRAVRDEAGAVVDFEFERSNPAALRMVPPRAAGLSRRVRRDYPQAIANGTYASMFGVLATGAPWQASREYRADGVQGWFLTVIARIDSDRIISSFLDLTEQKEAELAAREAHAQLALAAEVAGLGLSVRAMDGPSVDVSPRLVQLLGLPPATRQITLEDLRTLVPEADWARLVGQFADTIQRGEPRQMRYRIRRAGDGEERLLFSTTRLIPAEAGQPARLLVATLDVTEAEAAQQQALLAREELLLAAEVAGLGLTWRDLRTNYLRMSPEFRALFGYPPDQSETTLMELVEAVHPDDLRRLTERGGEALERGEVEYQVQYRIRHRQTGDERHMLTKTRILRDGTGQPLQMLAVTLDLTDTLRAQQQVVEAQAQLAAAAEVAGLGLSVRDLGSDRMRINPTLARLLGLDPARSEIHKSVMEELVDPDDLRRQRTQYFEALQAGLDAEGRYRIRRVSDGAERVLHTKTRLIRDAEGRPVRAIAATLDLTDTIRAEEQARLAQAQLALAAEVAALGLAERELGADDLWISAEYARIVGLPAGTTRSSLAAIGSLLDPTDAQHIFFPYQQAVLRGESPAPIRLRGRTFDGRPMHILVKTRVVPAVGEQPARVQSVVLDLTDTVLAEQRALEAEQRLKLAAETAGVGLAVLDLRTNALEINTPLRELLGMGPDEVVDRDQLDQLVLSQLPITPGEYRRAIVRGEPQHLRLRLHHPTAPAAHLVACTVSSLRDNAGKLAQVVTTVVDITDAVQAEQRATEAQVQLGLIAELAGVGLSVRDLPGRDVTITPGYARIYGLDPTISRASIGRLLLLTHPDDRAARVGLTIGHTREPRQLQFRIRRADTGEERTLLNSARVVPGSNGQPDRMVVACLDISDMIQAQRQADEVRTQLLLATEVAGLGLSVRDVATGVVELTPAFARLYGFDPSLKETTLETLLAYSHPDDVRQARPGFDRELAQPGAHSQVQYRIRRADTGEERTLVASARTVGGADGQPVRVVSATLDVTDLVRARSAAEQLRFWRTLTDGLPEIMWVADTDGKTTQINQRWYDYTGHTEDDIRQHTWVRALHPTDLETPENQIYHEAFAQGRPYELKFRLRRHDGAWRWHVARAVPVRHPDGTVAMWVGLTMDVHEREEALAALRRANQDLDTFIYAAAHDLKSPIDNLEGIITALREESLQSAESVPNFDAGPLTELLGHADGAVARFRATLADLAQVVDLQRSGHGGTLALDLPTYIADLVLDMEVDFAAADGYICLDLRETNLTLPPRHLRSLLFNLLTNALKYRHPDRPARLWLRSRAVGPAWVELAVSDNGIGLDPARATRAFELFGRLHPGAAGGTGIGLFIVRRIVEQAGGQIRVSGKVGQGTTFYIRLPR